MKQMRQLSILAIASLVFFIVSFDCVIELENVKYVRHTTPRTHQMKTATKKRSAKKSDASKEKPIGPPVEKGKSYTQNQLEACLNVRRTALWRYRKHRGLEQFGAKVGGSWQITGEQYHAWLDWLREQAKS